MDRSIQLRYLAEAEQHIARGQQNISDQERRIKALDLGGHDVTLARSVLETFLLTQAQHLAHRDQILSELAELSRQLPNRAHSPALLDTEKAPP